MKHIITITVLLLATVFCHGQKEHLEPARDFKQYEGLSKEYYGNVFPLLYKGFNDKPYVRYTSMPSFSREYAFSIEQTEEKYHIISNSLSENYWYAKKKEMVKTQTQRAEIGEMLYLKIGELFQLLVAQTKYADNDFVKCDGVTYYFSITDNSGRIKTGETWSPYGNSLLDRLVKICDKLYSLKEGNSMIENDLISEIEKLIIELKE